MSDGNSPSTISYLRQYRFQRKPGVVSTNGVVTIIAPTATSQAQIRIQAPQTIRNNQNGQMVYKRIRVLDSDSDDASSPAKRPNIIQPQQAPFKRAVIPSQSTSANNQSVIQSPPELTTQIKERRFRNMLQMFPDISPMLVKNVLVKHQWNEERSRDELLKHDPETEEKPSVSNFFGSRPGFSGQSLRMLCNNSALTIVRKPALASKGGRARRGSSGSEDDDYGVRKGKDDRVYDSDDSDNEVTDDLIGDKKKVFDFLNRANINELILLSGCSQKKAEVINSLRPFKGWLDMVEKFNSNKTLSTELLNSTQELLSTRNNIQKLMKKCVGLAQQLESAVAAGVARLKQPGILDPSLKLAPYQLVGLNWLAVLHKQGVSGILADEMGLGKTVQVIAFLAHLKETGQARGTHLIVVPASTLDNWCVELARWCPTFTVSKYYGPPEERRQLRIEYSKGLHKIDIVLTTYTMVSSCPEERKMFRITPMHYVIYDEAHMLKNMSTQRYDNLLKIKSKHRLLLTGTPLQNNLLELMSLLCFVMPHMFSGKTDDLKNLFQKNAKAKTVKKAESKTEEEVPAFEQSQITQAKRIMKPFLLRRLKKDVLQDLPKKTNHTVMCKMSEKQELQYKNLIAGFAAKDGTIHATLEQSGISMMMDMRKLANHPLLLRFHYGEMELRIMAKKLSKDPMHKEKNEQYIFEDMACLSDFQIHQKTLQYSSIQSHCVPLPLILDSGKFNKLDEMLPKLKAEGHRVLIFSQFTMMMDILEPYLSHRGYRYLRLDGSTAVMERQDLIDQYNEEDIFCFLLSTKAGGLGINLTAADTVIIHDIDFNPYNDKQAEDRCHRMGQTREVTIYRLLSVGTIEEGIYQVAQEKLILEKHVTETDENEPTEQKNVVRLLSAALGLTSPTK